MACSFSFLTAEVCDGLERIALVGEEPSSGPPERKLPCVRGHQTVKECVESATIRPSPQTSAHVPAAGAASGARYLRQHPLSGEGASLALLLAEDSAHALGLLSLGRAVGRDLDQHVGVGKVKGIVGDFGEEYRGVTLGALLEVPEDSDAIAVPAGSRAW